MRQQPNSATTISPPTEIPEYNKIVCNCAPVADVGASVGHDDRYWPLHSTNMTEATTGGADEFVKEVHVPVQNVEFEFENCCKKTAFKSAMVFGPEGAVGEDDTGCSASTLNSTMTLPAVML